MRNSRTSTHDFYPHCTLKFSSEPRSRETWCNACGNHINGFVYHCRDEDLDLHPCCLELEKKMVSDGVRFKLCDKVESKCIWCNRKSLKGKSEGGWSYKSKRNKCHVHVRCVTEMILQNWKTGEFKDDDTLTLSLKNPELHLGLSSGGGQKYLKIAKALMSTVVAILLGDPTMLNLIIS
ncbi:hypothetical protein DCAR_0521947 [Daucus carota subsp. sativus]|uniref:DC1 domain-containing protein n=1 Tax=Daucus carota subsp. sativus TaxID=79200 RepID=A0AAF1B2U9_DAUCS|nr:hypothetical protein DCAR_0521947 [Daucus carota subsp. sativus]